MAAINYSGSQSITGCIITTWTTSTYYSFKLTQDCKISVDGTPAVNARSGDEFIIQVNTPYIFDRDTIVLLSYPTDDTIAVNEWEVNASRSFFNTGSTTPTYDIASLSTGVQVDNICRITIGIPLWLITTTNGAQLTGTYLERRGSGDTQLLDNFKFYSKNTVSSSYAYLSFLTNLFMSPDDVLVLSAYAEEDLQIGSSTSTEDGKTTKIKIEKMPTSENYQGAWQLNHYWLQEAGYDLSTQEATPTGIWVSKLSGTKMFVVGSTGDAVDQFTLSTANDTSDASVTYNGTFSVSTEDTVPQDVFFSSDGLLMFIVGDTGNTIETYSLTTADVITSGVSHVRTYTITEDTTPTGACFNSDGTKLWLAGDTSNIIYEYNLSTAYNTTTMTYSGDFIQMDWDVRGVRVSSDDKYLYVLGINGNPTANRVTQLTIDGAIANYADASYSVILDRDLDASYEGIDLSGDGKNLYTLGYGTDIIYTSKLGY